MPRDNTKGTAYSTNNMPRGTRTVDFYRLNSGPNGSGAATKIITAALLENFDPRRSAAGEANQAGQNLQDKDWSASRGPVTASAVVQVPSDTAVLLRQGDYFQESVDTENDGSASGLERFVITEVSNPESQGDALKQNITLRLDRRNSPRWAAEFA